MLFRAYEALRAKDYDTAIAAFLKGIEAAPERASVRKDLAYTYLKIGENELAREQFREAMRLEPNDAQVAMEYAFLCYETKEQAEARRIFDRIRKTGNATAEQAFQNIDDPLAAGIERWRRPSRWARQFQRALRIGHAGRAAGRTGAGRRALSKSLASAARPADRAGGPGPRVEGDERRQGRGCGAAGGFAGRGAARRRDGAGTAAGAISLRRRVPRGLELDPGNVELRRELGYLLLRMDRKSEAEAEFRVLTQTAGGSAFRDAAGLPALCARGRPGDAAFRPRARPGTMTISPTACAPYCACRR